MKEFMLLIRNHGDQKAGMSPVDHLEFVKKCELYIGKLKQEGKLISAQPLVREGKIISGSPSSWKETPFNAQAEIQVGYYHILANDLDAAVAIAKENPEFQYGSTASIEVRPVKMKEDKTGFVYPRTA